MKFSENRALSVSAETAGCVKNGGYMERIDESLFSKCIEKLRETGHVCNEKKVVDVFYTVHGEGGLEKKPVASIFPDDRYIQFHDEFTQIGIDVPGIKDLLNYGWECNHT